MQPHQHVQMPPSSCRPACRRIPRAALAMQPHQDLQMPPSSRCSACRRIQLAALAMQAHQHLQPPFRSGRSDSSVVARHPQPHRPSRPLHRRHHRYLETQHSSSPYLETQQQPASYLNHSTYHTAASQLPQSQHVSNMHACIHIQLAALALQQKTHQSMVPSRLLIDSHAASCSGHPWESSIVILHALGGSQALCRAVALHQRYRGG
jgi:hypothetical protein